MLYFSYIKCAECRAYNRSRKEFGMRLPPVKNKIHINSLFCKKLVYKKLVQETLNKYAGFQFWFQEAGERKCYYYCFDFASFKRNFHGTPANSKKTNKLAFIPAQSTGSIMNLRMWLEILLTMCI